MMMTSANQPALAPAPPASAPSPPTAASNHVVIKAEPPADMSGLNTFSDAVSQLLRASRIHQQQQQDHHHQQQQQVNPKAAEGEQEEAEEDDGGESDEGSDAVEVRFISFSSSSSRERFLNQPTLPPLPKKKKKKNQHRPRQTASTRQATDVHPPTRRGLRFRSMAWRALFQRPPFPSATRPPRLLALPHATKTLITATFP